MNIYTTGSLGELEKRVRSDGGMNPAAQAALALVGAVRSGSDFVLEANERTDRETGTATYFVKLREVPG